MRALASILAALLCTSLALQQVDSHAKAMKKATVRREEHRPENTVVSYDAGGDAKVLKEDRDKKIQGASAVQSQDKVSRKGLLKKVKFGSEPRYPVEMFSAGSAHREFSQFGADPPFSQDYEKQCQPDEDSRKNWAEYKNFHEQCRKDKSCLNRALIWKHDTSYGSGGLGDNLKDIAFTLYAAMASKRPFFISSWNRLGQDVLKWFEQESINVTLPSEPEHCESMLKYEKVHHARHESVKERINMLMTKSCKIVGGMWMRHPFHAGMGELLASSAPWMSHVKEMYHVGCAIRFLFKPLRIQPADAAQFPSLPDRFSVVHIRTNDAEIGSQAKGHQNDCEANMHEIKQALQCAKGKHVSNVLFLSTSEACKTKALEMQKDVGIHVFVSTGVAKLMNYDHSQLSADEFRAALWSEFQLMAYAELLITNRLSGFSECAASIATLPADRYLDSHSCQPRFTNSAADRYLDGHMDQELPH